jgi:hypothetical protein
MKIAGHNKNPGEMSLSESVREIAAGMSRPDSRQVSRTEQKGSVFSGFSHQLYPTIQNAVESLPNFFYAKTVELIDKAAMQTVFFSFSLAQSMEAALGGKFGEASTNVQISLKNSAEFKLWHRDVEDFLDEMAEMSRELLANFPSVIHAATGNSNLSEYVRTLQSFDYFKDRTNVASKLENINLNSWGLEEIAKLILNQGREYCGIGVDFDDTVEEDIGSRFKRKFKLGVKTEIAEEPVGMTDRSKSKSGKNPLTGNRESREASTSRKVSVSRDKSSEAGSLSRREAVQKPLSRGNIDGETPYRESSRSLSIRKKLDSKSGFLPEIQTNGQKRDSRVISEHQIAVPNLKSMPLSQRSSIRETLQKKRRESNLNSERNSRIDSAENQSVQNSARPSLTTSAMKKSIHRILPSPRSVHSGRTQAGLVVPPETVQGCLFSLPVVGGREGTGRMAASTLSARSDHTIPALPITPACEYNLMTDMCTPKVDIGNRHEEGQREEETIIYPPIIIENDEDLQRLQLNHPQVKMSRLMEHQKCQESPVKHLKESGVNESRNDGENVQPIAPVNTEVKANSGNVSIVVENQSDQIPQPKEATSRELFGTLNPEVDAFKDQSFGPIIERKPTPDIPPLQMQRIQDTGSDKNLHTNAPLTYSEVINHLNQVVSVEERDNKQSPTKNQVIPVPTEESSVSPSRRNTVLQEIKEHRHQIARVFPRMIVQDSR